MNLRSLRVTRPGYKLLKINTYLTSIKFDYSSLTQQILLN